MSAPTDEPAADAALLARVRDGSAAERRAAERELFERHAPSVERMLRRMLGTDTEDCLQEVFLDVFGGLPAFEGQAKLSTWIYRVAMRRAWKCAAQRQRHRRGTEEDAGLVEHAAAPGPAVDAELDAEELARRFAAALDRLDLDQRAVMALSAVDGLGPGEIAEVLGVPVGTVHSRLHRARGRMREWLGLA